MQKNIKDQTTYLQGSTKLFKKLLKNSNEETSRLNRILLGKKLINSKKVRKKIKKKRRKTMILKSRKGKKEGLTGITGIKLRWMIKLFQMKKILKENLKTKNNRDINLNRAFSNTLKKDKTIKKKS